MCPTLRALKGLFQDVNFLDFEMKTRKNSLDGKNSHKIARK